VFRCVLEQLSVRLNLDNPQKRSAYGWAGATSNSTLPPAALCQFGCANGANMREH
jgi:hypothetical protein